MLLYLARHGNTEYNAQGLCQGQLDIPLNSEGRQKATELSLLFRDIPLTSIYSSDLCRAHETAKVVAEHHPHLSIALDPALQEQYWGSRQGHPHADTRPADMEPQSELNARIEAWLRKMIQDQGPLSSSTAQPGTLDPDPDGRVVLAVSHHGCLLALRHLLFGGGNGSAPEGIEVETVPHVNLTTPIGNTSCVVLRIWQDDKGSPMLKVRIEAWAWAGVKPAST